MKGILDFLEKAGLVKTDAPATEQALPAAEDTNTTAATASSPVSAQPEPPLVFEFIDGPPLKLDDIYASEGVRPSIYPAERLLRLVDGLSAMDEATRQMAIKAMDAADESWTIADPLNDAASKVKALAAHAQRIQSNLQQLEHETQAQLDAVNLRQEQVVGNIRKQIAELEALAARELTRAEQETAKHRASLKAASEQTTMEIEKINQARQRLQSLSTQFGSLLDPTPQPGSN